MAEVITTIGTRSPEDVTIDSVSGSDPEYTVVLTGATSETNVGDSFWDTGNPQRSYLITAIVGATLTVVDSTGVGSAPDDTTGYAQAQTKRYYSTVSGWDGGLIVVVGELYPNGTDDNPTGHLMDDGAIVEDLITVRSDVVGDITLTSPVDHRHEGAPQTGARIEADSDDLFIVEVNSDWHNNIKEVSWIELDGSAQSVNWGIRQKRNAHTSEFHHLLAYDGGDRWGGSAISTEGATGQRLRATRCMAWNWVYTGGGGGTRDNGGISSYSSNSGSLGEIHNCTVWKVEHGGTKVGYGIYTLDHANKIVKQNICIDCDYDFYLDAPGSADYDYNCSLDDTTSGDNSLEGETAADTFLGVGPVDLHLKAGSACIGAGYDPGTTPDDVEFDIDNDDVSGDSSWDIGADQSSVVVTGNPWNYYAQQGGI